VGAGIGGLVTAIALARKGIRVTVFEQAHELAPVGASITLGPNAVRLLRALDLLEPVRRIGVRAEAEEHFGAPALDFLRSDLQGVLADAVPAGALTLGAKVMRIDQDADGVTVSLDGGRRIRADAVVAADGIKSSIRQQLVGADDPVFSGTVVYRGLLSREDGMELQPDAVNRYWIGPYRHVPVYWIATRQLLAVNCAVQEAEWSRESWTDEAEPGEVLAYLDGWDPSLLERVRRCRTILRGAVFVRRPIEHWSFDRVTLLGDAAHAMSPMQAQGAAQAIEDAFILAECLSADEVVPALERYERLRMPRATDMQASSSKAGDVFYLPDGEEQLERDAGYATLHERQPWGHRQQLWEHDVRSALDL
jgi:salicylate hydroxylase